MKTISMVDFEGIERVFDTFECVCYGKSNFAVCGWYFESYLKRNRSTVGYFLNLDAAIFRLEELNAQLEAAEVEGGVV